MGAEDPIIAKAIYKANIGQVRHLYTLRQKHIQNLQRLREQQAAFGIAVPIHILNEIEYQEDAIAKIEVELKNVGLPGNPNDLLSVYGSIDNALRNLHDAQEVAQWIKANFPSKYASKLSVLDNLQGIVPRTTGKWKGRWASHTDLSQEGDAVMAVCQIGDMMLGSGALSKSIFYSVYVEGKISGPEIQMNLFAGYTDMTCSVIGQLFTEDDLTSIRGEYVIEDHDHGIFEAKKEVN